MDRVRDILIFRELQQEERRKLRVIRRGLRDMSNPFELPDETFKKLFRLPKDLAQTLYNGIEQSLAHPDRCTGIPQYLMMFCALNFYAHGSYQKAVGQDFHLALSQASVSRCIDAVTNAIVTNLLDKYVKYPTSDARKLESKRGFMDKFHIPGIIGAIDCTHIAIVAPPTEDETTPGVIYINRKGYHSINVQLICDSQLKILNVDARFPGSTHDAAIWSVSNIKQHMEECYRNGDRGNYLLGDSGYPLQPWLLTPVNAAEENSPESAYNKMHCSIRNVVERLNGVLKQRFRCLLRHRVLHYSPLKAGKIIYACCVLHNMMRTIDVYDIEQEDAEDNYYALQNVQGDRWYEAGRRTRDNFINTHFT